MCISGSKVLNKSLHSDLLNETLTNKVLHCIAVTVGLMSSITRFTPPLFYLVRFIWKVKVHLYELWWSKLFGNRYFHYNGLNVHCFQKLWLILFFTLNQDIKANRFKTNSKWICWAEIVVCCYYCCVCSLWCFQVVISDLKNKTSNFM